MKSGLDARLEVVTQAVRPGSVVADVGTDHGYLICALVQSGHCPRGYASDINIQPLASAQAHIRAQGLEQQIVTLQSDGLRELPGNDIDDVVLAGMGGELIGELLLAVDWTRAPDKRFVLQPMTRADSLRRTLYRAGFVLCEETAVASGRFVYTVMMARYVGECREVDALFAYGGLLRAKHDTVSRQYCDQVCCRLRRQAEGLQVGGYIQEAGEIACLLKQWNEEEK